MTGSEIRRWARKEIAGKRMVYVTAIFFIILPIIVRSLLLTWAGRRGVQIPFWSFLPLDLASSILSLGMIYFTLVHVHGEAPRLTDILAPLRKPWLKKVVEITLVFYLFNVVLDLFPLWVQKQGQAKMGYYLELAISFVVMPFFFLPRYLLFLTPEKSIGQVIKDGVQIAKDHFLKILGFFFMLVLSGVGVVVVWGLLTICISAPLLINGGLVVFVYGWFLPWMMLASTRFAVEILDPPKTTEMERTDWRDSENLKRFAVGLMGTPSPLPVVRREMKLVGNGWYYYNGQKARRKGERENGI